MICEHFHLDAQARLSNNGCEAENEIAYEYLVGQFGGGNRFIILIA